MDLNNKTGSWVLGLQRANNNYLKVVGVVKSKNTTQKSWESLPLCSKNPAVKINGHLIRKAKRKKKDQRPKL